jgi:DNA-binding LacI/PurR family transcriptional regulator
MLMLDDEAMLHAHFLQAVFRGVELAANAQGITASLIWATEPKQVPSILAQGQIDGVLLVGFRAGPELIRRLTRIPAVWLTSHEEPDTDAVLPGNEDVARMAVEYLLDRGHRRVAFMSAKNDDASYRQRGEVFRRCAESADAEVILLTAQAPRSRGFRDTTAQIEKRLVDLVDQLLALQPKPTGLFVPADMMTALAYPLLAERGATPGGELEIISCDNEEPYLAGLTPRPATIDIGCQTRGQRAVEQLLWRLRHPEETHRVQLTIRPILVQPHSEASVSAPT